MLKKIIILGTGGTIGGTAAVATDHTGYTAAQIGVEQLVSAVPGLLATLQGHALHCEQVAQLDSKDMDFSTMARLAARCLHWLGQADVAGIVVTHGTDTLEETAYFLHLLVPATKPVVLTCAMRPATSSESDGPRNLRDAITLVQDARAHGVLCVCAGDVHLAARVQKRHTYALNAFDSGDAAPVARILPAMASSGAVPAPSDGPQVVWNSVSSPFLEQKEAESAMEYAQAAIKSIVDLASWPRVEIILNHAGAGAALVRDLLATQGEPVRGIVAAGTGNGTLNSDLQAALVLAQARGVQVVRSTRCVQGSVMATANDSLPHASQSGYAKARIAMVLQLAGARQPASFLVPQTPAL